ncbi:MAG: hypothetical protein ACYCSG_05540 [Thermoplasmataceae archaeon]
MKKRNKYFSIFLIFIIVVAFSSFTLYEIKTEPLKTHSVTEKQAYAILHNCTNSRIENVTLKAYGNTENLMMGTDTVGEIQATVGVLIPITVTKISQSLVFPYNSMSYVIKNANIYCEGYNISVYSITTQNQENFTTYILCYSFHRVGNLSLIIYVQLAGIAESGIFHFTGNTYTVPIRVNITVTSYPP